MADPIVQTDPIKQHHCRLVGETAGEHFGVVGEDLLGNPIPRQPLEESITDRPGRSPRNQPGDDTEPGMVVDTSPATSSLRRMRSNPLTTGFRPIPGACCAAVARAR
jgi:hypothetical protein